MATPAKQDFKIKANSQWTQVWQVQSNGVPIDITDFQFEIEVKKARGHNIAAFIDLSVGNGITILDGPNGQIQIDIPQQPSITTEVTYVYDLIAVIEGLPYCWIEGHITFIPGVSYFDAG